MGTGRLGARAAVLGLVCAAAASAQLMTRLAPETDRAFEKYIAENVPRALKQAAVEKPLPWLGNDALARVKRGDLVIRGAKADEKPTEVPNGLIHDWTGALFIPGTTLEKVTAVTQDFARHKQWYPEIVDSRLIAKNGDTARGSWLLKKKKVITVVLRAELDSQFHRISPKHAHLTSTTKPIIEVDEYGTAKQKDYAPGEGHGFLWRFNGYWTFHEADGGVYVECRVVSLSRDVPGGLGWIVNPFVRSMPKESLESTLTNTRKAAKAL